MSSTTTRCGAAGAVLAAALEAATAGALEIAVDAGGVDADAAPLDVPAGVVVTAGETTGADDGALACLEPELQAAANVISATSGAARR
ncbi:MAG TPA: hypothetical protein VGD55_06360 [Acidothermaceae bacterium]